MTQSNISLQETRKQLMQRRKSKSTIYTQSSTFDSVDRDTSLSRKKCNRKLRDLNAIDRINLVHQIVIDKDKHAIVAEQYMVKNDVV